MNRFCVLLSVFAAASMVHASWYWPFDGAGSASSSPRLSELMEPVTELIDTASDLAADSKVNEAVEKYREALLELDKIEMENEDRVKKPEFATVRNKRAYVNAAIDALLLHQVKSNARGVAASDTTELEKRLEKERAAKRKDKEPRTEPEDDETEATPAPKAKAQPQPKPARPAERKLSRREQVISDLAREDYAAAELAVGEMLVEKPNDAAALNLKAAVEIAQEKYKEAEETLDRAIRSNPRSHYAYYNLASLILQLNPSRKEAARRYYQTGRSFGGPVNAELEAALQ